MEFIFSWNDAPIRIQYPAHPRECPLALNQVTLMKEACHFRKGNPFRNVNDADPRRLTNRLKLHVKNGTDPEPDEDDHKQNNANPRLEHGWNSLRFPFSMFSLDPRGNQLKDLGQGLAQFFRMLPAGLRHFRPASARSTDVTGHFFD